VVNALFRARPGMKVSPKRVPMETKQAELNNLRNPRRGSALALTEAAPKASATR
jgi:hypothetical protein